jgi:hypothetical protein
MSTARLMQAADFFDDEWLLERICKSFSQRLFSVYEHQVEATVLEVREALLIHDSASNYRCRDLPRAARQ